MDPIKVAFSMAGVIIVIIACYYATYYIGSKASGQNQGRTRARTRTINLLDRFAISKDKSFCIVEIAGKIYIIGVTNQAMTVIDTIDPGVYAEYEASRGDMASWYKAPGGRIGGKLFNSLSSFMAGRMGKTRGTGGNADAGGETFEDSMRAARANKVSGQPNRVQTERPDDPEGEE